MSDLQRWYDYGRERGARWLLITWDCVDREWVPVYRSEAQGSAWTGGGMTWTCQWVVDLNSALQPQSGNVSLVDEP